MRRGRRVLLLGLCIVLSALVYLRLPTKTRETFAMEYIEPPRALPEYAVWAKRAALAHIQGEAPATHLTLIMGNEAGDLDSAASALSLAYLLGHDPKFASAHGLDAGAVYAPLLQTPRSALRQRRENLMVYEALGIDLQSLLCIDDLGVDRTALALSPSANVSLGLVDHAKLTPAWGDGRRVDLVVDHHEDEGAHETARLRIVRSPSSDPVGSAASIVASLFQDALQGSDQRMDRSVADLLLSAIILDTKNLRMAPDGKATETDAEAYNFLLPVSSFHGPERIAFIQAAHAYGAPPTRDSDASVDSVAPGASREAQEHTAAWAKALKNVKADVSHLSTHELLARDFKDADVATGSGAVRLGISSVPLSLSSWLSEAYRTNAAIADVDEHAAAQQWAAWWASVMAFMRERRLDVALVLTSFKEPQGRPKSRRDLAIVYATKLNAPFTDVAAELQAYSTPSLELAPYVGQRNVGGAPEQSHALREQGLEAAIFRQGNTNANRKVVQPAIVRVLQKLL